ncbi:hypothetical protein CRG98_011573 [Punica granatum]|uniref:Uncharacterized protein n=1 Tax=Punica granatum TaxID=22663 RepID=A0A2I0KHH4_PUNGR|nr:hypothetical protein CRG98_011573 [Punica granatum]
MVETGKVRLVRCPKCESRTTLFTSASAVGLCSEVRLFPLPLSLFKTMNNLPVPGLIKKMKQSLIQRRSWGRREEDDKQYPDEGWKEKDDEHNRVERILKIKVWIFVK